LRALDPENLCGNAEFSGFMPVFFTFFELRLCLYRAEQILEINPDA